MNTGRRKVTVIGKEFWVQDKELIDPKIGKIKGTTPDTFW